MSPGKENSAPLLDKHETDQRSPFRLVSLTPEWEQRRDEIASLIVNASSVPTEPYSWRISRDVMFEFRKSTLDFHNPLIQLAVPTGQPEFDDVTKLKLVGVFTSEDITDAVHSCLDCEEEYPIPSSSLVQELNFRSLEFKCSGKYYRESMNEFIQQIRMGKIHVSAKPKGKLRICEAGISCILPEAYGHHLLAQYQSFILDDFGFDLIVASTSNRFSAQRCLKSGGVPIVQHFYDQMECEDQFPFQGANQEAVEFVRSSGQRSWCDWEDIASCDTLWILRKDPESIQE